jgi:hypothetical protein
VRDDPIASPEPTFSKVGDDPIASPEPSYSEILLVGGDEPEPPILPLNESWIARPMMVESVSLSNNAISTYQGSRYSSLYWFSSIMLLGGVFTAFLYRKRFMYTPIPNISTPRFEFQYFYH